MVNKSIMEMEKAIILWFDKWLLPRLIVSAAITGVPTYAWYMGKGENPMSEWWTIIPYLAYGLISGLTFWFFIKAQAHNYRLEDSVKNLIESHNRLHKFYLLNKERFKMVKMGDTEKIFSQDIEWTLWRNTLNRNFEDDYQQNEEFIKEHGRVNEFEYRGIIYKVNTDGSIDEKQITT